jgi:transposase
LAMDEGEKKARRFSREFKLKALRRLESGEKPATQLAMELGIRRNMLVKWREELHKRGERAFGGAGRPAKSEQSEIARLKGELKRVSEERDILKKAAAYFGKRRR